MGIEYELKFRAARDVQAAILAAVPGEDRHFSMQTTYYDTPTGQLSQHHYTLRRRMENGISVCTLKAPAPVGRGEWETACDRIEDSIGMLCKLGGPAELPQLVSEGLNTKLKRMPEESQYKLQHTLSRIINEDSRGLLCIILS